MRNGGANTATRWTDFLRLHHAEEAALASHDISATVTRWTCFWSVTFFASVTVACIANHVFADFEFLCYASGNLLQIEFYFHA